MGAALVEKLARLGVARATDLLFLLPQRYEDRTRLTPIGALRPGTRAVIEGTIALAEVAYRRRRSLLVRVMDGTGQLTLRLFYFSRAQEETLRRGAGIRCYGEARPGPAGLEMVHPEYRIFSPDQRPTLETALTPVYPTTEGIQQFRLRSLVGQALDRHLPGIMDWLPAGPLERLHLPPLREAIRVLHRPPPDADGGNSWPPHPSGPATPGPGGTPRPSPEPAPRPGGEPAPHGASAAR